MSAPSRPIMVRIPPQHAAAFDAIRAHYGGLPQSMLLKMALREFFERPLGEQLAIIDRQIKKPTGPEAKRAPRRTGSNTNRLTAM